MALKQKLDDMSLLTSRFEQMNSNEFIRSIKIKNVTLFLNEKYENPSMSKKDICKKIGVSLPVLNQNLKDLNYTDFVRKRTTKKKTKQTRQVKPKEVKLKEVKELKGGANEKVMTEEEKRIEAKELLKNKS